MLKPGLYRLKDAVCFFTLSPGNKAPYHVIGDVETDNVTVARGDVVMVVDTTTIHTQTSVPPYHRKWEVSVVLHGESLLAVDEVYLEEVTL